MLNMSGLPNSVLQGSAIFVSIIIEAVPFVLFGCIITGLLQSFLKPEKVTKYLPKNKILSIMSGIGLGVLFPSCECGIVPVVKELIRKGVPDYTAIAFMLTAPIVNPVVLFSTYIAFNNMGYPVFLRVVGSVLVSLIVGLWLAYSHKDSILKNINDHVDDCHSVASTAPKEATFFKKIHQALKHSIDEFFDTGRYLVIGALLAAIMQTYLKTSWLFPLASNKVTAILVMLLFALLLSLCSEADAFIGATLVSLFGLSPVIAFLVYGPMIDVKNLLMMGKHFKTTFVMKLVGITTVVVFVFALVI